MASFTVVAALAFMLCVVTIDAFGGKMGGGGGGAGGGGSGGSGAAAAAAAAAGGGAGGGGGGGVAGGMCPFSPGCPTGQVCYPVAPRFIFFQGSKCRYGCRYQCFCPPPFCPPPKPGCYNQFDKIIEDCPDGLFCSCKVCRRVCMKPYY